MIRISSHLLVITSIALITIGCSSERKLPARFDVNGSVTLDGEPLKSGSISFRSEKDIADGMVASADIVEGQFTAKVPPGEKTIVIHSIIQTNDPREEFKDLVPVEFNKQSTLTANVNVESTQFNFDLKTN
ncbi:hypothetical protein AB1K70_23160 [Bremerella sp. JC770]|uniref:hypothetical protein n=1 Tax=Bremerella sp. JC770 TaxID=3232137 RepID=UPI00345AC1C7